MAVSREELNDVDEAIGMRLQARRMELQLSQTELAKRLGVSFQQVQKYEKGHNRISGSRLWDLCRILDVVPNFFFQDVLESVNDGEDSSPRLDPHLLESLKIGSRLADTPPQFRAALVALADACLASFPVENRYTIAQERSETSPDSSETEADAEMVENR